MSVASQNFELHPPYFANQYNVLICTNDISMIFSYLYWFHTYQKTQKPVPPVQKGLLDLYFPVKRIENKRINSHIFFFKINKNVFLFSQSSFLRF